MVTLSANNSQHVLQNMGLIDRVARFLLGGGILAYLVVYHEMKHPSISLGWQTVLVAASIYPLVTALIGWDPFYALFHTRSCSLTGRNQCGTFPYEVKAIVGHAPKFCDCSDDQCVEHSLEACHDTAEEPPHHATWRVDREPMIYPSDAQLSAYFVEQARKDELRKPVVKQTRAA